MSTMIMPAAPDLIIWGAASSGTGAAQVRYLSTCEAGNAGVSSVQNLVFTAPRAGTFRRMHLLCEPGAGTGNVTYTLRIANSPTALTFTVAIAGTSGSDTANSVAVTAGQSVAVTCTADNALITGGHVNPRVAVLFYP